MHKTVAVIFTDNGNKLVDQIHSALDGYNEANQGKMYYNKEDSKEAFIKWRKENPELFDTDFNMFVEDYLSDQEDTELIAVNNEAHYKYNERGMWDWFSIGGRWKGMLKIKDKCKGFKAKDVEEQFDKEEKDYEGYDVARIQDLDLDKMKEFHTCDMLDVDKDDWISKDYNLNFTKAGELEKEFISNYIIPNKEKVIAVVDIHY